MVLVKAKTNCKYPYNVCTNIVCYVLVNTGVSNVDLTYQLTVQNNDTFIQINYNGNTYTNSKGLRIKPLKKVSTIGSNFLVLWYMYIIEIIDSSTYLLPTHIVLQIYKTMIHSSKLIIIHLQTLSTST